MLFPIFPIYLDTYQTQGKYKYMCVPTQLLYITIIDCNRNSAENLVVFIMSIGEILMAELDLDPAKQNADSLKKNIIN